MIPFVRTLHEAEQVIRILKENGLDSCLFEAQRLQPPPKQPFSKILENGCFLFCFYRQPESGREVFRLLSDGKAA